MLRTRLPLLMLALLPFVAPLAEDNDSETARTGADPLLPNVVVIGKPTADPGSLQVIPGEENRAPAADGADLLRSVNGLSAGRMGGRGLEPVIRGQSQGRLNVLVDGAYVFGACPNRMDPPSSFAATEAWDRITVLKGVQTLLWGGGGSGGTILYERDSWPEENGASGRAGAASTTNGTNYEVFGDLGLATERFYLRTRVQQTDAGDYEDGNGDKVRSAFEETAASLETGMTFNGADRLEFSVDATRADDVRYPGAGMDAPKDDSDSYRLRYESPALGGQVSLESWYTKVHHRMDNFSVRNQTAPMAMKVPARSRTAGGRVLFEVPVGPKWELTAGLDYLDNSRHATRFQGSSGDAVNTVNSYLWPGADLTDLGLTLEGERPLAGGRIKTGLRYDHVEAGVGKADADPAPPPLRSPNALYRAYYGRSAGDENEDNVSGLLRYERPTGPEGMVLFAGVSRTLRTADATERYLAMDHAMNPAMRWVGNPGLDPEDHRQADVGFSWQLPSVELTGAAFYDNVKDYITPDRARGQDGILLTDGARVYRNVDAEILGAELEAQWFLGDHWRIAGSAAWVRAENTDDDRALPQIPPLNGQLEIHRSSPRWDAGARLRWADRQSRADDNPASGSGLDARETPGYGVVDVFGRVAIARLGSLGLGVDNLLDKTWSDHLNRANQDPFNPDPVQVNEPGRTLWANWRQEF